MKLNIETYPLGPIQTNCYLIWPDDSKDCWIIDPGGSPEAIIASIQKRGLTHKMIILTHGHWDHFLGNADLKKAFPDLSIAMHQADSPVLPDASKNMSQLFVGTPIVSPPADCFLNDSDEIMLGEIIFKVIHTPGHTPGGICLYSKNSDDKVIFVGDLIFAGGGVGRTDLPMSSTAKLYESIARVFKEVSDDTKVYSGHGPASMIKREKSYLSDL